MANEKTKEGSPPPTIQFSFLKSNSYRAIHVDGAWGGITPDLNIHMGVFCQRLPFPNRVVHKIVDGDIGPETERATSTEEGIVREIEADIVMNAEVARSIIKWLQLQVDTVQRIQLAAESEVKN